MRAPKIIVAGLIAAFALSLLVISANAAPGMQRPPKKPEPKPQERATIPKEIKAVIQEGLATRQGRQDIPFAVFKDYYFPTPQTNLIAVLLFKVKNEALGYGPPVAEPAPKGKTPQTPPPAPPADILEARVHVFLDFLKADETGNLKTVSEYDLRARLQTDKATFDPSKEEWYSIDYWVPPGKYTLAMAIATPDLKKVGVQYYDMTLPGPETYKTTLETTPIFFVDSLDQEQSAESRVVVRKGFFKYSVLRIVPSLENTVKAGKQAEVFFYIFGAKTKPAPPDQTQTPQQTYDIEVNYEVQKEDGSPAIKWAASQNPVPIIDQPLPLQQTLKIKDEKGERTETRDLPPGKYVMVISIKDNVSGETIVKKVPMVVV